jgi:hypothetical protein
MKCYDVAKSKNALVIYVYNCTDRGRGSSVGMATRYGLEGPGIECRWRRAFPHLSDRPWGPTSSCTMGTGSFPGGKGGRGVTLTTHPHLVPRSRKSRVIPLLPLWVHVACYRVKPYLTAPIIPFAKLLFFNKNLLTNTDVRFIHVSNPGLGFDRPLGFLEVQAPRLHDNRHTNEVNFSALCTGRLYPQVNNPDTYSCYCQSQLQNHSVAGRMMSLNNSNYTIGNRTRNLPACSSLFYSCCSVKPILAVWVYILTVT